MGERSVKPEILDSLDTNDPAAMRSRKDLKLINYFMRGEAWILKKLDNIDNLTKVVEIGAGDGQLATKIKAKFPASEVTAIDLIERPNHLPKEITWRSEDVMKTDCFDKNTVIVSNLFIHHLNHDQLWELGEKISSCRAIIMAEPHRYWFSKLLGYITFPLVNHVTKHDMIASINAGFRFGELAGFIDVDWHWDERAALGSIRSIAKQVK